MSDLIRRLRTAARKACERHNRVDQFDPAWKRKPKVLLAWEAADEIERLQDEVKEVHVNNLILAKENKEQEAEIERLQGDLQVKRLQLDARMVSEFAVDDAVKAEIKRLERRIDVLHEHDGTMCPLCAMEREIERLEAEIYRKDKRIEAWKQSSDEHEERIERLRGHYERIKAQTCLCRFDKAAGEGESGTIPHTECEYHKAMHDEIERLRNSRDAWFEEYERVNKENERRRAVVDAARPIADNYTGFAGHIELIQALAALEDK